MDPAYPLRMPCNTTKTSSLAEAPLLFDALSWHYHAGRKTFCATGATVATVATASLTSFDW